MRIVSNEYKSEINELGREIDVKLTYGSTTITGGVVNSISPVINASILSTMMKQVTIDTDTEIPIGTKVKVEGVLIGENENLINYGYYTIKESNYNANSNSYEEIAYDDMMQTMVKYDLNVTYPITVKNLLTSIASHFNYQLNNTTFVNDDTVIDSDVFSGINFTYRDVLDELAVVTCSTIEIENGVMYLKYPNETNAVIDEGYLKDSGITIGKKYGPVNSIVFAKINDTDLLAMKDDESIEENGLTELKISDKQILSTTNRSNFITEMYDYLDGLEYYTYDIDTFGITYLEALDKFKIKIDNVEYPTILLNDEIEVSTSGIEEQLYVEEPKATTTDYTYTASDEKRDKQAYILIDKQNSSISSVVSSMQDISDTVNGEATYTLTTDTTYQEGLKYYILENNAYKLLIEGTDYQDGDTIIGQVYTASYNDTLESRLNSNIEQAVDITTISKSVAEQLSDQFNLYFTKKEVEDKIDSAVKKGNEASDVVEELQAYIKTGADTILGEYQSYIILGKTDNNTRLQIIKDRIRFMTGEQETAYISNNALYINESTILTRQVIGKETGNGQWITEVDDNDNLNTYWKEN